MGSRLRTHSLLHIDTHMLSNMSSGLKLPLRDLNAEDGEINTLFYYSEKDEKEKDTGSKRKKLERLYPHFQCAHKKAQMALREFAESRTAVPSSPIPPCQLPQHTRCRH